MRAKVVIAYDGSRFYGSQHLRENGKSTLPTVLSVFEEALRSMGIFSPAFCAGRTDRFVHATGQVIGFELPEFWLSTDRLKYELDKKLYPLILIKKVDIVNSDFHPRFSAKKRIYHYMITTSRPSIFQTRFITHCPQFDLALAREAIAQFRGTHDFYHFSKRGSDEKTTIRTIFNADIYTHKKIYIARFAGDAFLRSQIRMMMSAVISIAAKKAAVSDIKMQLSGEKIRFRNPANASGLYLSKVIYATQK